MQINKRIESVAVIGAGASGAVTAAALHAENYFKRIRVFERRDAAGGTWIHDAAAVPDILVAPGSLPPEVDPPLKLPQNLPRDIPPNTQERFTKTPIYNQLTTNVPDIAMSFSDIPFPYGPFVPHHIPKQYIETYFSAHATDSFLELNTTVEDLSRIPSKAQGQQVCWKLTLRKYDTLKGVDKWWEEYFDAVVLANGHYTVPFVPDVQGLGKYIEKYPGRVLHSKTYRTPSLWAGKKVVVVGNSASGIDITRGLRQEAQLPVYQSRRSRSRWDGDEPPEGVVWKPIITKYSDEGRILFSDGSYLDDVDAIIYCTGYKPSFPFWNTEANGRPLFDYASNKLIKSFQHTFFQDFATLGIVGMPRVLTFRSMEYQAIVLARHFSGRLSLPLPPIKEQERWEQEREEKQKAEHKKFHDIAWEGGETIQWLTELFQMAGLGTLSGDGRLPPVLDDDTVAAINKIKKYPEPDDGKEEMNMSKNYAFDKNADPEAANWVRVDKPQKDVLSFI